VLDATSMLFLLVVNAVFLGISVYMSSRVSTSRVLARNLVLAARRPDGWPSWWR
jgi:hydrogenase-4 component F